MLDAASGEDPTFDAESALQTPVRKFKPLLSAQEEAVAVALKAANARASAELKAVKAEAAAAQAAAVSEAVAAAMTIMQGREDRRCSTGGGALAASVEEVRAE